MLYRALDEILVAVGAAAIGLSILFIYSEWKRQVHDVDDDELN